MYDMPFFNKQNIEENSLNKTLWDAVIEFYIT